MTRINVHLDDVESGFELIPEGPLLVEIQESSKAKKSKEGLPKITWVGEILEGEYEGEKYSWDTSLAEAALWSLKGMLEKIDIEWDEDGFDLEDCFGKQLIVDNVIGKWKDEDRNYVEGYHRA